MRRLSKKNVVVALLLLAGGFYFINFSDFLINGLRRTKELPPQELTWEVKQLVSKESRVEQGDVLPQKVSYQLLAGAQSPQQSQSRSLPVFQGLRSIGEPPSPQELNWEVKRLVSKESWVEQGDYLPLNVSYQLLAGAPSPLQRYLSVGISSIQRQKGSYLIPTLQSLFSQSSPEERSSMVVVLLLADFDVSWRVSTLKEIRTQFPSELEQGQLLVLHVTQDSYPPITGLKRNYNDSPDRVSFRSKQNLDYAFLMHFSAALGRYYLQLEDDVSSSKNFLSSIRRCVNEQEGKKTTWATLEFSNLGFIGKLYKSAHLPLLARFLLLFYQEMPCDWLMSHFRTLLTQKEPILFKPSLFQHMGTFSSFQGIYNKLKDKDFEDGLYNNPPAQVFTNMSAYQKHVPRLAWEAGEGIFWARSPEPGNHLTVVLEKPVVVTGILVETGAAGKDLLERAQVELGNEVVSKDSQRTCKDFRFVGALENGRFEGQQVDKKISSASSCLRILVTAGQKDWVIFSKVRISVKSS